MNRLKQYVSFLALCACALSFAAQAQAHDAKVVKVNGAAEVQLPGQSSAQRLTPDMAIPEGAVIKTYAGAQVYLETMPGVVATIESESTVLVEKLAMDQQGGVVASQEAMLDLKKGSIVSTLDPKNKAINRYGVRTPKGVAAARGTVYGVSVSISGTSVATLSGTVSVNLGNGVTVDVPVGSAVVNDSTTVTTLAAAIAASGQTGLTVEQLLAETVQAVAANVAANTSAAGGSDTATAVLAAVVNAASAAAPNQASAFAATAIAAATSSTSATAGNTNAAAAITEAAVRAAPNQTTAIAQAAARAAVETQVAEAVAAAKASGGDVNAAATQAAMQAQAAVSAIAQAATTTGTALGVVSNPADVAAAVNNGSRTGAVAAAEAGNVPPPANPPTVTVPSQPTTTQPPASAPITPPTTPVDLPPVSPAS
ncbi:MAG TPA: FecR domain-containing protein [Opitutus sp.]|nr:FecR domain-containing protein [Opitutus sp.]